MKVKDGKTIIDIGECDGEGLVELSVSRSKKWKSCQMAHDYRYVQKLRPKAKVRPLSLGSLVHECLENRALGKDWISTIKNYRDNEFNKLFEEERFELGDIPKDCFRIVRGYHYHYLESDKRFKTIGAEIAFRVRIPNTPVVLVGLIDLVVMDTTDNGIWCIEHKTAKKGIPTEDFRATDIQTSLYNYVLEKLATILGFNPQDIKGVILDYLKTQPPTIPEVLKNGTLSKRKITCDRLTYTECIKKIGGDPADYEDILSYLDTNIFYRRIPLTKSQALTDATIDDLIVCAKQIKAISGKCPTRNLSWNCDRPKCEYRDLCIADVQGLDTSTLINLNFIKGEDDKNDKDDRSDDGQL